LSRSWNPAKFAKFSKLHRGVLVPEAPVEGGAPMRGTEEAFDLLGRLEQLGPEELPALLAMVSGREGLAAADAVRLRERLAGLLAEAQRDVEELLARTDRRLEPEERAAADAALPPARPASAAGAYLSLAAPSREVPAPAAAEREAADRPPAAAPGAAGGRDAEIGELTARILAIQEGLSAL
jgi:hypothetical protein